MADMTIREKTVTTIEFALTLPTNWVEIYKASHAAETAYKAAYGGITADDAITVTSDGEEIVFGFASPKVAPQSASEFLRNLAVHFNRIDPNDWNGGDVVEYLTGAMQARGVDVDAGAA